MIALRGWGVEKANREHDAKEAAGLLLEEKKRREENDAWWKAKITKREDRAKDAEVEVKNLGERETYWKAREAQQEEKTRKALEEWGRAMGERDGYAEEIEYLEDVIVQQAKEIYLRCGPRPLSVTVRKESADNP